LASANHPSESLRTPAGRKIIPSNRRFRRLLWINVNKWDHRDLPGRYHAAKQQDYTKRLPHQFTPCALKVANVQAKILVEIGRAIWYDVIYTGVYIQNRPADCSN
jgi:hypothetical protein